jgi:hypothetical protein
MDGHLDRGFRDIGGRSVASLTEPPAALQGLR